MRGERRLEGETVSKRIKSPSVGVEARKAKIGESLKDEKAHLAASEGDELHETVRSNNVEEGYRLRGKSEVSGDALTIVDFGEGTSAFVKGLTSNRPFCGALGSGLGRSSPLRRVARAVAQALFSRFVMNMR